MIEVKINVDTIKVEAHHRKLTTKWGCKEAQDPGAFHGTSGFTNHISAEFRQVPKKGDLIRYTNTIDPRYRPEGEFRIGLCLSAYNSKKYKNGTVMIDDEVWSFSPSPHTGVAWIEVIDA